MLARRGVLGMLAGGGAAVLTGCSSSASFRYRMTVEGNVSGSAVYELLAEKVNGPRLADERPGGSMIKGEALIIETASGPVFVLLTPTEGGRDLIEALVRALAADMPWNGQPNFWKAVNRLDGDNGVKAQLPQADWPMMVRFRNLNDSKTVERVDPTSMGVKRISLETTNDAVTKGIKTKLPWLKNGGLTLDPGGGPTTSPTFSQTLYQSAFTTEIPR